MGTRVRGMSLCAAIPLLINDLRQAVSGRLFLAARNRLRRRRRGARTAPEMGAAAQVGEPGLTVLPAECNVLPFTAL